LLDLRLAQRLCFWLRDALGNRSLFRRHGGCRTLGGHIHHRCRQDRLPSLDRLLGHRAPEVCQVFETLGAQGGIDLGGGIHPQRRRGIGRGQDRMQPSRIGGGCETDRRQGTQGPGFAFFGGWAFAARGDAKHAAADEGHRCRVPETGHNLGLAVLLASLCPGQHQDCLLPSLGAALLDASREHGLAEPTQGRGTTRALEDGPEHTQVGEGVQGRVGQRQECRSTNAAAPVLVHRLAVDVAHAHAIAGREHRRAGTDRLGQGFLGSGFGDFLHRTLCHGFGYALGDEVLGNPRSEGTGNARRSTGYRPGRSGTGRSAHQGHADGLNGRWRELTQ
jgi:hypothetical protein